MDIDAAFDSVLLVEDNLRKEGRREGEDHGKMIGFAEGYTAGIEKGSKIAAEIGFVKGSCTVFQAYLRKEEKKRHRALKVIDSLLESIDAFPMTDPTVETYVEDLEHIRTKFRQLSAMLHIPRTVEGDTLSF